MRSGLTKRIRHQSINNARVGLSDVGRRGLSPTMERDPSSRRWFGEEKEWQ